MRGNEENNIETTTINTQSKLKEESNAVLKSKNMRHVLTCLDVCFFSLSISYVLTLSASRHRVNLVDLIDLVLSRHPRSCHVLSTSPRRGLEALCHQDFVSNIFKLCHQYQYTAQLPHLPPSMSSLKVPTHAAASALRNLAANHNQAQLAIAQAWHIRSKRQSAGIQR